MTQHYFNVFLEEEQTKLKEPMLWLFGLCLLQIFLWTIAPYWVRHTLNRDTLEGIVWGNLWQWSYSKHPPLTAWIVATVYNITNSELVIYLLSQVAIAITFVGVWRFAKEFLSDRGALLSVFLLQGILYFNLNTDRFTPDNLQGPIWAWLVLTFYWAITKDSLKYWVITGFLAGLSILTKYQVLVLFASMFISLFWRYKDRYCFLEYKFWIAFLVMLIVIAPNLYDLYRYDENAISYLQERFSALEAIKHSWIDYIFYPFRFFISALGNALIFLILFFSMHFKFGRFKLRNSFKYILLVLLALGPFVFTIISGFVSGQKICSRWATQYLMWLPLLFLVGFNISINDKIFKKMVVVCCILAVILCFIRTSYQYFKPLYGEKYALGDEYLAAREQSDYVNKLWSKYYDFPMPYMGGLHYNVVEILPYNQYKTIVPFLDLDPKANFWMTLNDFKKAGGMILILNNQEDTFLVRDRLKSQFPEAVFLERKSFIPVTKVKLNNLYTWIIDFYIVHPQKVKNKR